MSNVAGIQSAFVQARTVHSQLGVKLSKAEVDRVFKAATQDDKKVDAFEKQALLTGFAEATAANAISPAAAKELARLSSKFQLGALTPSALATLPVGTYEIPLQAEVPLASRTSGSIAQKPHIYVNAKAELVKAADGSATIRVTGLLNGSSNVTALKVDADGNFAGSYGNWNRPDSMPLPNPTSGNNAPYGTHTSGSRNDFKGSIVMKDGALKILLTSEWSSWGYSPFSGVHGVTSKPYLYDGAIAV